VKIKSIPKGLFETLVKEFEVGEHGENLGAVFQRLGIIGPSEIISEYTDRDEWHRGGAETYVASGMYRAATRVGGLIAKALVGISPPIAQQVRHWTERRQLLAAAGVPVPELYWAGNGLLLERFIDKDLRPISHDTDFRIVVQLASIAAALDGLGFVPIAFLRDLREADELVYFIDFGSDLGSGGKSMLDEAWKQLERKLTGEQVRIARAAYDSGVQRH
jgi:hypothetical protein